MYYNFWLINQKTYLYFILTVPILVYIFEFDVSSAFAVDGNAYRRFRDRL